jgi:hypothetical protein
VSEQKDALHGYDLVRLAMHLEGKLQGCGSTSLNTQLEATTKQVEMELDAMY